MVHVTEFTNEDGAHSVAVDTLIVILWHMRLLNRIVATLLS